MEVNGANVEGESHARVIELIKSNPDKLCMQLVSVPPKESERLDGETTSYGSDDEVEIKNIDITIPSISQKDGKGKSVAYYNIYFKGKFLCSHRYKAFYDLQVDLKNKFFQFEFPRFPGKWPFALSQSQLEKRHKELEQWLSQVCSVSQIFDHFYMQDFLGLVESTKRLNDNSDGDSTSVGSRKEPENADIKVQLPDKSTICVNIPTESSTKDLCDAVCQKVLIPDDKSGHFNVFKCKDSDSLDVPLSPDERPLELYVQSYNDADPLTFKFKKFVFSNQLEEIVSEDATCLHLLYEQAVEELSQGKFEVTGKEIELNRTQHPSTQKEFLKVVRTCGGYNTVTFPHCACDSRKDGHVILSISNDRISIQACSLDGEKQDQIKNFTWASLSHYDKEGTDIFHFTISKTNSERKITLKSQYAGYMRMCVQKITDDRNKTVFSDEL